MVRSRTTSTADRVELGDHERSRSRTRYATQVRPNPPARATYANGPGRRWSRPPDGPGCFPTRCTFWDAQGEAAAEAWQGEVGQVRALNVEVLDAVQDILARSARPPVIVLFSDHGHRLDSDDPDEMLRSFFASYTPDHRGLFPQDTTPVNVLPRLLNAYGGLSVLVAVDVSYAVALDRIAAEGFLKLQEIDTQP